MTRFFPGTRYTNKPPIGSQVDLFHPVSAGIQDDFLFNQWAGKAVQNIGPSALGPLASSASIWTGLSGPITGGLAVGASGQTCVTPFTSSTPSQLTMVLYFYRTATIVINGILATMRTSGTGNLQVSFQWDGTGANLNCNMADAANTSKALAIPFANLPISTPTLLVGSFDRVAGTINAWVVTTGIKAFSGSPGAATAGGTTTAVSIALGGTATGAGSQGFVASRFTRYNRLFTATDVATLAADPYANILPPALRRYWVVPAAASGYAHRTVGQRAGSRTIRPVTGGI